MGNALSEELFRLSRDGKVSDVESLLKKHGSKCQINWKNPLKNFQTSLHIATRNRHKKVVEVLIQWKARTNMRDSFGWSALDYACYIGRVDIADILTDDPNWVNNGRTFHYNETSLHIACRFQKTEVVKLLLNKGASVHINAKTSRRNTPLHYAVLRRNAEICSLLLDKGASLGIRNLDLIAPPTLAGNIKFSKWEEIMKKHASTSNYADIDDYYNELSNDANPVELLYDCEPIEISSIKCIVAGPSQAGKTVFLNRLISKGDGAQTTQQYQTKPSTLYISLESKTQDVGSPKIFQNPPDDGTDDLDPEFIKFQDYFDDMIARLGLSISKHEVEEIMINLSLHVVNIGSQTEISEIIPLILQGPALYLLVFNLACKFEEEILRKDGYTTIQTLHQFLSSVYFQSKQFDHLSKAILFGTHKNEVDSKWDKEKELVAHFKNATFLIGGFLVPVNQSLIYPIDNENGDHHEVKAIKEFLKKVVQENFRPQQIQYTWALFYVALRHKYKDQGVCRYSECVRLAKECGIEKSIVPEVLKFIHQNFTTILYFGEIEGLHELVICNPDIFFAILNHVIAVALKNAEHRKTGEISLDVLEVMSSQQTGSMLKGSHIVDLLKHFNILTKMPSNDRYFMPCLLLPDSKVATVTMEQIERRPLLVQFDNAHIPMEIFSALVISLSHVWKCDKSSCYRNHLSFFIPRHNTTVELIFRTSHLEVHATGESPPYQFIWATIKESLLKKAFSIGFYCPGSFAMPHFCSYNESMNYILCSLFPDKCAGYHKPVPLPNEYLEWFTKKKELGQAGPPPVRMKRHSTEVYGLQRSIKLKESEIKVLRETIERKDEEADKLQDVLETLQHKHEEHVDQLENETNKLKELVVDQQREIETLKETIRNKPYAPSSVVPDPVFPSPVVPDPVSPSPVVPDPVSPSPVVPDPVSPSPVVPDPVPPFPVVPDMAPNVLYTCLIVILLGFIVSIHLNSPRSHPSILSNVDVLATMRLLVIGGKPCHFIWDEYGLRLDIPHDALPTGNLAEIKIHVSVSGPYVYPDSNSWRLASAVYWIWSNKHFLKPIQLGIWHSIREKPLNSSILRVVMADDETQNLHYTFKYTPDPYHFDGSYVYVSINHFSSYATVSNQDNFRGSLLYRKSPKSSLVWEYSFIVYRFVSNGIINRLLGRTKYVGWIYDLIDFSVEFEENSDAIILNLALNDSSGWKIKERNRPLMYHKKQLYSHDIISNMQFFLIWTKKEPPTTEFVSGLFKGAKQPEIITFLSNSGNNDTIVTGVSGGLIPDNKDLLRHIRPVYQFLVFCHYLLSIDEDCQKIERERPNSIEEQKLWALTVWQGRDERTWKDFISVLAMMDHCRTAKELADKHDVYFYDYEDALSHCPTINDRLMTNL